MEAYWGHHIEATRAHDGITMGPHGPNTRSPWSRYGDTKEGPWTDTNPPWTTLRSTRGPPRELYGPRMLALWTHNVSKMVSSSRPIGPTMYPAWSTTTSQLQTRNRLPEDAPSRHHGHIKPSSTQYPQLWKEYRSHMSARWTHHGTLDSPWRRHGPTIYTPLTSMEAPHIHHGRTRDPRPKRLCKRLG